MHGDLKPENLLFTTSRHLQLTDFGSAKDLSVPEDHDEKKSTSQLRGTADYISPEASCCLLHVAQLLWALYEASWGCMASLATL